MGLGWKFLEIVYSIIEIILLFFRVIFSKAVIEPFITRTMFFEFPMTFMIGLVETEKVYLKFFFSTLFILWIVISFTHYYIKIELPILFEIPAAVANGGALIFAIYFPQTLHGNDLTLKALAIQGILLYFIGMFIFLILLIINGLIAYSRGENIN